MAQIISLSLVLRKRPQEFETSTVQVRFYRKGTAYYVPTAEKVETALWDAKTGRVKIPNRLSQEKAQTLKMLNRRLDSILQKAQEALYQSERDGVVFDAAYLKAALGAKKESKPAAPALLLDSWAQFILDCQASLKVAPATLKAYRHAHGHVAAFAKAGRYQLTFDTLTPAVAEKLIGHLKNKGLTDTTVGNVVKNLKVFLRWAHEHGHTAASQYTRFKKPAPNKVDFVYLTESELSRFAAADLPPHLARIRDLFVLQSATGLRFSDLSNLKPENVSDGALHIVTVKTKDPLRIPLSPEAQAIIARYEGNLPRVIQNQPYNREVKEAARLAGIDTPTPITKYRAGHRIDTSAPKCEHISSHTARRTFIIHALEKGIRPEVLMKVTGHKDIKTLMRYVKITPGVVDAEFARTWTSGPRLAANE